MKILHFADVHLGRNFNGYAEVSGELSEARYETLERLIATANEKQCDAVVIAGDLFERPRMKKADVVRAVRILNQFEKGPVLVLPGNHDYMTPESDLWRYVEEAKEEFVLVLGSKEPVSLEDFGLEAVAWPAPCFTRYSSTGETGWIQEIPKDPELLHIGVAHGSLEGVAPDLNDEHYPMTHKELEEARVDTWLLGHIHVPWPDYPGPSDRIYYSGTPEPDNGNCTHRGTALLIDIDEQKQVQVERLSTGRYRFERWEQEVAAPSDLDSLLQEARSDGHGQAVCRLTVRGKLDEEVFDSWNREILPELREAFLYLKVDDSGLKRKITEEQIRQEFPEQSFPDRLLSTFIDEDEDALQTAYELINEVRHEN